MRLSAFCSQSIAARNAARILSRVEIGIVSSEEGGLQIPTLERMYTADGGG